MGATGLPFLLCFLLRGVGRSMHSTYTPPPTKVPDTIGSLHATPNHTVLALWFDGLCTSPWVSIFWFTTGSVTSHVPVCGQFTYQPPAINTANPQQIFIYVAYVSGSQFVEHSCEHSGITRARWALAKSMMHAPCFVCVRTHRLFQQEKNIYIFPKPSLLFLY